MSAHLFIIHETDTRRSYEVQDVSAFLTRFDSLNLDRIGAGLQEAKSKLESLAEKDRGIGKLQESCKEGLYAIFEALNSDAALRDEDFLDTYFNPPFLLVQTHKRLRLHQCPPAFGYFVFQTNSERHWWATTSLARLKRDISATEFEWSVREPLSRAMSRVQLAELDASFLPIFWAGVKCIVTKLDADLITHSLRALEYDICRLALDHLQVDSDGFRDLLLSVDHILQLSPRDFWEAMSTTPASVWIDQFARSRALSRFLGAITESDASLAVLEELFKWVLPFVSSIKPIHSAPACRALVDFLLHDIQNSRYANAVREFCFDLGIRVLASTMSVMGIGQISNTLRAAIKEMLELVHRHMDSIITLLRGSGKVSKHCAELMFQAIALDIHCLNNDRDLLASHRQLPEQACALHTDIWERSCAALSADNLLLARYLICGFKGLVGMEGFIMLRNTSLTLQIEQFNAALDAAHGFVADTLERLNEFESDKLRQIFEQEDLANALISQLLSSHTGVRSAVVDTVKTISGRSVRKEAFGDVMSSYFEVILNACSLSLRRITLKATFAPATSMLNVCKDLLDVLCNSSNGLLRVSTMSDKGIKATESFWQALWKELSMIFYSTEHWSNLGHQKEKMIPFCGDVMEFAGMLFDQFAVFAGAISTSPNSGMESQGAGLRLTEQPKSTLPLMVKFLRLRDDFLLSKSAMLVCDVLRRLRQHETTAESEALYNIENVITGKTKTVLSANQKAELHRALEEHLGESVSIEEEPVKIEGTAAKTRSGTIDLDKWRSHAERASPGGPDRMPRGSLSQKDKLPVPSRSRHSTPSGTNKNEQKGDPTEFARKRQEEIAAKKKRDAEAIAKAKARMDSSKLGGSALSGLGVSGKDHSAPKGEGILVSSDEESDDAPDDIDMLLFGESGTTQLTAEEKKRRQEAKMKQKHHIQHQGPVRKQRLVRSAKDMRARLAPDLSPLHKHILGWDPNHTGAFPPKASAKDYASVLSTFRDPFDYQNTFQPLLLLEAWNGFLKAKEENTASPVEMKIINRSSVDAFAEASASIDHKDSKDIGEGDIVIISRSQTPLSSNGEPKCLSRIAKIIRKKTHVEVLCRIVPGSTMGQSLNPNSKAYLLKIMPIVPLEREYGALLGLQYYDLCEEITQAKPSPLLPYRDEALAPLERNYVVNKAQAKAIKSALDNDAFTLIQGPPGSGKTKTIVAIVGALLTSTLQHPNLAVNYSTAQHPQSRPPSRKMLVCAPSNAAVDELVMRFKEGVKTTEGRDRSISVVRLGRSDAINSNVHDVTLDELVDRRLNVVSEGQAKEDTQKIMRQHQDTSAKLREARARLDKENTAENRRSVEEFKKAKALLSQKVDMAKDNEGAQSRQAEINRRKAQQEVIEEAHVICATLSGSGHDMFQNLNVEFETVVIDEAAQCVELSALIPLKYGCAKCILVGDPQQLPPTVFSREAANFKYEQSLFVRMQSNHQDAVHLLDTQYRMHPAISTFPSQTFYNGLLRDGPDMAALRTRPWHAADLTGPFQFFDVQGQHSAAPRGHSLVNYAEIQVAMQLYRRLITDFKEDFTRKVGVITPYKSQLRELKSRFRAEFGGHISEEVEFNTTDAFQGRESEIIIFSCVRANPSGGIGFLQDIRRMNVGLTRAKSSLWVLGNSQSLVKGQYWKKLVEHAKSSGHFAQGNIEALLSRPLKIVRRVNAPSAGEKRAQFDQREGSDDYSPKPSNEDSDTMMVDCEDESATGKERDGRAKLSRRTSSASKSITGKDERSKEQLASKLEDITTATNGERRKENNDVDMEDVSAEKEQKVEAGEINGVGGHKPATATAAAKPKGIAKRPPPKKNPPSVFLPPKKRK